MFAERNPWQAKDVAASAPPTAEQLLARFRTEAFMVGHNAIQAMMKGDR